MKKTVSFGLNLRVGIAPSKRVTICPVTSTWMVSPAQYLQLSTTDSAVRITHIPTGLVVTSQDEKSQLKNKNQAMRILRARLLKAEQEKAAAERAKDRKEQVGSGERSDKIRTYNYKDNRVSDHRINLTLKKLDQVLDGDLDQFVDALIADNESRRLANLEE